MTSKAHKKEFLKIFNEMCYSRSGWQVWADLISAIACSMANSVDKSPKRWQAREQEYAECIKRLGGVEKPAQCFACIAETLSDNPNQDFLGELYMELNLGNHWKGQFFTPFSICKMMASITIGKEVTDAIKAKGYIAVNDCACGAGATLIAAANRLHDLDINYQNRVMFVSQDIDRIAGLMCYIQLSLLGCPGYVVIADTLTNPVVGYTLFPEENPGQEFWYMPMWFSDIWQGRIFCSKLDAALRRQKPKQVGVSNFKKGYFFFDFSKPEQS